ncbi:MAG: FtsQ-type POTRA domain-containing protein [Treponema sp.]|nr:FtsQ-type POTRA domain-containing protein [Treponema sp.]
MSGSYSCGYAGSAEDEKTVERSTGKIEKGLKRLLLFAGIILAGHLIWLFIVSPCIPFTTVDVHGFAGFNNAQVLGYANISESASFISVKALDIQRQLYTHPLVESARVIKRFPDRLSIYLEPRVSVAVSLAAINGRQRQLHIDRQGVVFKITNESSQTTVPVISGLAFENPAPGMKLPAAFVPLLEEISVIGFSSPELLAALSEIRINRKDFDDFDLILYSIHSPIRVRLEKNISEETLRYVMLMLDVFKTRTPKPQEIDFRSGMGSYTIKEAHSG